MLHKTCEEGKRLLDSYLMALSIADSSGTGAPPVVMEERHQALIAARNKYWKHVRLHNCRGRVEKKVDERAQP